ncbi:MAG TPA: DUF4330 domain-containing protein [Thermosynechococcaceae cyanobacterium]
MAIVDSKGRLFGRVSILDIGAVLVILLVALGVLLPSTRGAAQIGANTKPVEVDVVIRSVGAQSAQGLLKEGDKTSIVIRNQPYGEVKVKAVRELTKNVPTPQPDGSIKSLPDPRPEANLSKDYLVTVVGDAQMTKNGPVLGNNKIKIGTQIELEGFVYDFPNLSVLDVRVKG